MTTQKWVLQSQFGQNNHRSADEWILVQHTSLRKTFFTFLIKWLACQAHWLDLDAIRSHHIYGIQSSHALHQKTERVTVEPNQARCMLWLCLVCAFGNSKIKKNDMASITKADSIHEWACYDEGPRWTSTIALLTHVLDVHFNIP